MQKECPICGIVFSTDNKNRKYCDDCATHTRARMNEYEKAAHRAYWRSYYDDIVEHTCKHCGKVFKMPQYLVDREFTAYGSTGRHVFCSKRCFNEWDEQMQNEQEEKLFKEILRIYSRPRECKHK